MRIWLPLLVTAVLVGAYFLFAAGERAHEASPQAVTPTSAPPPATGQDVGAAPPPPAPTATPTALGQDKPILEIDLTGRPTFYAMLEQVGIEDVEERLTAWGAAHGYPQFDEQGNALLDQPYDQYDNDTLGAFAANDDMWAQQILAARIAKTRPAEALELYRKAAINGSVHAMTEMAKLYRQVASSRADTGLGDDEDQLAQVYALRDGPESLLVTGYAWAAVAERAGWDPLRGSMTASFVGSKLNDDQLVAACDFAQSLYGELVDERAGRGLDEFDRRPPPVVFDSGEATGTACYDDSTSGFLSTCQEVHIKVANQVSRIWKCDD